MPTASCCSVISFVVESKPARWPASETPRIGAWVTVTEGAAAGAKGWIAATAGDSITMVAVGVGRFPLLLTIPAIRCQPLRRSARRKAG